MSRKQWTVSLYLLFVAMTLGAVLVLGIFVTSVIFHSDAILTNVLLDRYNEGQLMAEIFRRFSYWGYFMVAVVSLFELSEYKHGRRDNITILSASVTIATLLLFNAVYTPKIIEMQAMGVEATQSEAFASLHSASEIDFKVLAVALGVLFLRRMQLMFVGKN